MRRMLRFYHPRYGLTMGIGNDPKGHCFVIASNLDEMKKHPHRELLRHFMKTVVLPVPRVK